MSQLTRKVHPFLWTEECDTVSPTQESQFPPLPTPGGIMVTTPDVDSLQHAEFLNDVIIDFYLK